MSKRISILFVAGLSLIGILNPNSRGQTVETIHSFQNVDGASPRDLVVGSDGAIYGVAYMGGNSGQGTGSFFRQVPGGSYFTLHSFSGRFFNPIDGANPSGSIVAAANRVFYGTTVAGGTNDLGVIFKLQTDVLDTTINNLVTFTGSNGANPSGLVLGPAGFLYGATSSGGATNRGTIFKASVSGSLTTLYSFGGASAPSPLVSYVSPGGDVYGATTLGGSGENGSVFRLSSDGTFTSLHSFQGLDGKFPNAPLVLGTDGSLYGITFAGGSNNFGTIFQISTNGLFTSLYSFKGGTEGKSPSRMIQGSNGRWYGATSQGGALNVGTVFEYAPGGSVTTLFQFDIDNGGTPAGLIEGQDGNLYGAAQIGGAFGPGLIYRVNLPALLTAQLIGNRMVVSWPTNKTGFTLQVATNLNPIINWGGAGAPAVVGSSFAFTNDLSRDAQFFRLSRP